MRTVETGKAIRNLLAASVLFSCFLSLSVPLLADAREELCHPGSYVTLEEETVGGETIPLDNSVGHARVDRRSLIKVIFDKEKLLDALRALGQQKRKISLRIEAYVQPPGGEKYPITVGKYSTVVRKTETTQEASPPDSEGTKVTRFTTTAYEVRYHDRDLELTDRQRGVIIGTIVDTHLELTSLNLKEGDIVYLTISDRENEQDLNKVLEVKNVGTQVYLKSPIILTFRQSDTGETSLALSPGTTIVFKVVRRAKTPFEDWFHPGVNIAFLNFDEGKDAIEIGVAAALTIYKDFFEIGYGRNLTVREHPWYLYIGFNFVHLPGKTS